MTQNNANPSRAGLYKAVKTAFTAESSVIIADMPHDGRNELKIMTAFNGGNAKKYKALLAAGCMAYCANHGIDILDLLADIAAIKEDVIRAEGPYT